MIRVVKAAIPYRTICKVCQSELEFEFTDIKVDKISDWLGGAELFYHITCPVCKKDVNVGGLL